MCILLAKHGGGGLSCYNNKDCEIFINRRLSNFIQRRYYSLGKDTLIIVYCSGFAKCAMADIHTINQQKYPTNIIAKSCPHHVHLKKTLTLKGVSYGYDNPETLLFITSPIYNMLRI